MATWNISSNVQASGYKGVVTGDILQGGNISSDSAFRAKTLSNVITNRKSHGSITPGSGSTNFFRAATNETGAQVNVVVADHYVGPYITDGTLAGVAKTTHNTPASDYGRRGTHRLVSARRINITGWNYLTGAATYGGSRGGTYTYNAPQGGTVDDATNPAFASAGVPGELVYRNGSLSGVVMADYPTKNQIR
jgi:hypothetical protein